MIGNAMKNLSSYFRNGGRNALMLALLSLGACAPVTPGGDASSAATPVGRVWVAEDVGGRGIIDSSHITLILSSEGRASGRSGCNHYSGLYRLSGQTLVISRVAGTMMACAPALMDQEKRFLDMLARVATWRIEPTGALTLSAKDSAVLRFFPE